MRSSPGPSGDGLVFGERPQQRRHRHRRVVHRGALPDHPARGAGDAVEVVAVDDAAAPVSMAAEKPATWRRNSLPTLGILS